VLDLRLESQGVETCSCDWDSEEFSLHVASLASLQVDYQALWMRPTEPKTRSNWWSRSSMSDETTVCISH